jgi:hypothetical protein
MTDKLNRITGLSARERQEAIRWYARQSEMFRVELMKKRFRLFQDLKAKSVDQDLSLLEYAALCIAIKTEGFIAMKMYRSKKVISDKNLKTLEIRRTENAQSLVRKGRGTVSAKLAKKWGIVVELRRKKLSFQAISQYLHSHHKIKISRQYLHEKYVKWETKN